MIYPYFRLVKPTLSPDKNKRVKKGFISGKLSGNFYSF